MRIGIGIGQKGGLCQGRGKPCKAECGLEGGKCVKGRRDSVRHHSQDKNDDDSNNGEQTMMMTMMIKVSVSMTSKARMVGIACVIKKLHKNLNKTNNIKCVNSCLS